MDTSRLFRRHPGNPILTAADLPYAAHAVFNPGAVALGGQTLLLLRVEDFRGLSHFTVARSPDGLSDWTLDDQPSLVADPAGHPEDGWGIEDPRIVLLPELGRCAITFTSVSAQGPVVSLALTTDFSSFERLGVIRPAHDKDAALFPRRFGGAWLLIHRPDRLGGVAQIELSSSTDLRSWSDPAVLLPARSATWWDANKVGLGPPPLQTRAGWLVMYHGVRHTCSGALYRSGLALLDLEDPRQVLARLDDWVIGPEALYERLGDVPNVVFPSGWVLAGDGDSLRVYYGAADTVVGVLTASVEELLGALGR